MLTWLPRCSWRQGGGILDVHAWLVVVARLRKQGGLRGCKGGELRQSLEHLYSVAMTQKPCRMVVVKIKTVACVSSVGLYASKVTW